LGSGPLGRFYLLWLAHVVYHEILSDAGRVEQGRAGAKISALADLTTEEGGYERRVLLAHEVLVVDLPSASARTGAR
jgi:hypothetical protein